MPENSPTISIDEFNAIQPGMSYARVVEIIGGEGTVQAESSFGGIHDVIYIWQGDGFFVSGNASVMTQNGIVISKAQAGLN